MENYKNVKKIFSASDEMEAEIIISLLEANQILSYKQRQGNSDLMHIYFAHSIQGIDIMVREEDAKKALLLVKDYAAEKESLPKPSFPTKRRINQAILLFFIIAYILITIWGILYSEKPSIFFSLNFPL